MIDLKLHLAPLSVAAFCFGLVTGCMEGSEIPNELSGMVVDTEGRPQVDAAVSLYRSDAIPSVAGSGPAATARTDGSGRYRFDDLAKGRYNLLAEKAGARAYRDSLAVTGSQDLGADTLTAPGALAGRVQLVAPDSPRLALVQVLGTYIFVNVDSAGHFLITDLAEGRYRIRVFVADTTLYVPEYRLVTIRSGRTDTLPETLEPYYLGPPRLTGLRAEALADGTIRMTWNRARSRLPFNYAVFREAMDAAGGNGNALAYHLTDTVYIDTVYSRTPRPCPFGFPPGSEAYNGQYPWEDTTAYGFRYRVRLFDPNASEELGPPSDFARVTAIPPSRPQAP